MSLLNRPVAAGPSTGPLRKRLPGNRSTWQDAGRKGSAGPHVT